MSLSNFHTHTCYDHGADSPRALVEEAIRLGCPAIGFTGHSHTPFDDSYCMSRAGTAAYKNEIRALQQEYKGRIEILCGVEQDYYSDEPTEGYDYVIGSVHYLCKDGVYLSIDHEPEITSRVIERHFDGDPYAFAEYYYRTMADLYEKTHCNVVGHFDLITKFSLFDTAHPRYRAAALAALEALAGKPVIFELNTGAMARGYRTLPYPEPFLLKRLGELQAPVLIGSDCHEKEKLLFGFEQAGASVPSGSDCREKEKLSVGLEKLPLHFVSHPLKNG